VGKRHGSTETEQIKSGPLCGLSRPTDLLRSRQKYLKLSETFLEINDLREFPPPSAFAFAFGHGGPRTRAKTSLPQKNTQNTKEKPSFFVPFLSAKACPLGRRRRMCPFVASSCPAFPGHSSLPTAKCQRTGA
jgi:hypothetical protein